ncbi:hypothetical protein ABZT48_36125 [Streptomyces avermitilis]|uniref:hypothetical protein n=1 Tax=Streptomyces avermitilis TaxID=33903 RepID=UPI0033BEFC6A
MGGLLSELGKKIAERWLSLLVLPGAMFLAVLFAAYELRHKRWYDVGSVPGRLDQRADALAASGARVAVFLLLFLLGAAACGLLAQAMGSLLERLWLAADWQGWPAPLRGVAGRWVGRRQARYAQRRDELGRARALAHVSASATPGDAVDTALRRLERIGAESPARPTWMGDCLHAAETRLRRDLGLELAVIWPPLWLDAPDTTRTEITAAREDLTRATTLAGWGILYFVVGGLWWPGFVIPAVVILTAWRRGRSAVDAYAALVEAAARLHASTLAQHLGLPQVGPVARDDGLALTTYLTRGETPVAPPPPP